MLRDASGQNRAAAVTQALDAMHWRYLPQGGVRHALTDPTNSGAVCGLWTLPAEAWYGTGSQREYDRVESMPRCQSCLRKLGIDPAEVSS